MEQGKNKLFASGTELLAMPAQPDAFLIDSLLWEKDVVILLGDAKAGKSLLALQMACNLTSGTPFLGEYEIPEPYPVVYIQTEGRYEATKERLEAMLYDGHIQWNPELFHIYYQHAVSLNSTHGFADVVTTINQAPLKPRVIFLDPLYMSMEGDLSDNVACRMMAANLKQLSQMYNAAIVILHHKHVDKRDVKGEVIDEGDKGIMGSFVWRAYPDHVFFLYKQRDGLRNFSCSTQRSSRVIQDMKLKLVQPKPLYYEIVGTPDHAPYVDKVLLDIASHGPRSSYEIQKSTELSRSAVMKSLAYLCAGKNPRLYKINPGRRPVLYDVLKSPKDRACIV